ncbi:hypothetical protein ASD24_24595 [Paenibacillus sp. Root52]|uniref:hypothetical protein n=1 Tax=Paenibacillus sp. Root52 TaxID=1736552 RepID=UPI0006F84B63|nr:hypothetical protein [Paenibacillus sp. Root52]KQY90978.1 hypothetical protein ASD24_24595 [Paenibacillus sp. Root52]
MANNVVAFQEKHNQNALLKKHKELSVLERALKKDKASGVDFYKVALGDKKENQRLKMKNFQASLNI